MQKISKPFLMIICGVVALGFLSGIVGELWVNSFLLPDPYLSFKNYSDLTQKINDLISNQPSVKNVNGQVLAVSNALQNVKAASASIYRSRKFSAANVSSLLPSDLLGHGLVITNDGWIVTTSHVAANAKGSYLIVLDNQRILVSQKVVADASSGLVFIKIDANNLTVADFSLRDSLAIAEPVYLFDAQGGVLADSIKNSNFVKLDNLNDFVHNSETFYKSILLQSAVPTEYIGSPIITATGRVAGIVASDNIAIPVDYMTSLLKAVVKDQTWKMPYLGLKFYDLSELLDLSLSDVKGALVLKSGVNADSPAKGIILPDDIILKVENDELGSRKNLPELLSQYQSGDSIKFTIKRAGVEKTVEVKLGGTK